MKKLIVALIAFSMLLGCKKETEELPVVEIPVVEIPDSTFIELKLLGIPNDTVYLNQVVTVNVKYNIAADELELEGFVIWHLYNSDNYENYSIQSKKKLTKRSGEYEFKFAIHELLFRPEKSLKYMVELLRKTGENEYTVMAKSEEYSFKAGGMFK